MLAGRVHSSSARLEHLCIDFSDSSTWHAGRIQTLQRLMSAMTPPVPVICGCDLLVIRQPINYAALLILCIRRMINNSAERCYEAGWMRRSLLEA